MAVLAITFGATLLHVFLAPTNVNEGLGSIVALYTVAERRDRRTSLIAALVVATLFAVVIIGLGGLPEGLQGLLQTILVVWLAWALGDLARTRGPVRDGDRGPCPAARGGARREGPAGRHRGARADRPRAARRRRRIT